MSDGYFDALERELQAAVPRAASLASPKRRRLRRAPSAFVAAVGLSGALAVAAAAVLLAGHGHRIAGSPPAQSAPACAGASSVPTLCQLRANFAVLRRAQTAADRSWQPPRPLNVRVLERFTRLAVTLRGRQRIFLTIERFQNPSGARPSAAASYLLDINIVSPHRAVSSTNFGPSVNYTVFPLPSPVPPTANTSTTWASIIPDGVTQVRWTFACPPAYAARCSNRQVTITVPVRNNVVAATVPGTAEACGPVRAACRIPATITWYGTRGQVVATFSANKLNLTRPPFINANPTAPLALIDSGSAAGRPTGKRH